MVVVRPYESFENVKSSLAAAIQLLLILVQGLDPVVPAGSSSKSDSSSVFVIGLVIVDVLLGDHRRVVRLLR